MSDLVKRLWLHDMHPKSVSRQAADRIDALEEFARRVFDYSNDAHLVSAAEELLSETRSKT